MPQTKICRHHTECDKSGIILVDILTALALAAVFVVLITRSSFEMRDMFVFANERSRLMDVYEEHQHEFDDVMPYESRTVVVEPSNASVGTTTITASAHPYGNERIETDIDIAAEGNTSLFCPHIAFSAVRKSSPTTSVLDLAGTPLCSANFTSDHRDTPTITPILLPIDPALPLTDIEVRNGIAYISADSTKAADPDIFVVNIRDPVHPQLISSINTGPGISSISIAGPRIYAAAASGAAQLHIVRLLALNTLVLEKKYQLPMPYATATPPFATSITYDRNRVYLGTEKWDGDEFSLIDVSNATSPVKIGGLETGSQVQDIVVSRDKAYLAGSGQNQLSLIDMQDPAHPLVQNTFQPSGWERQSGDVVTVFEDALNLGRTSGGFNISRDHEAFSWATTSSATLANYASVDNKGGVYGMIVDRSHIYLASRDIGHEFQIYDRRLSTTTVHTYPLPAPPQRLTCDNDRLYVLSHTAPVIYQITFKK